MCSYHNTSNIKRAPDLISDRSPLSPTTTSSTLFSKATATLQAANQRVTRTSMAATRTTSTSSSSTTAPEPASSITKEVSLPTANTAMELTTAPGAATATAATTAAQLQGAKSMKRRGGNDAFKKDRSNRMMESMQIMQYYLSQQSQPQPQPQTQTQTHEGPSTSYLKRELHNGVVSSQQIQVASDKKLKSCNSSDVETDQLLNDILFQTTCTTANGAASYAAGGTDFSNMMFLSVGSNCTNYNHIFESAGSIQVPQNLTINIPNTPNNSRSIINEYQQVQQLRRLPPIVLSPSNDSKNVNTTTTTNININHTALAPPSSPYLSSTTWKPLLQSNHLDLLSYQPDRIFRERSGTIGSVTSVTTPQTPTTNTTETLLLAAQHVLQEDEKINKHVHHVDNESKMSTKVDNDKMTVMLKSVEANSKGHGRQQPKRKRMTTRSTDMTSKVNNKVYLSASDINITQSQGSVMDRKSSSTDNALTSSLSLEPATSNNGGQQKQQEYQLKGFVDNRTVPLIPHIQVTNNDVLLGRGGRTNHHIGNCVYRTYKEELQNTYLQATKDEKTIIANQLVKRIHDANGRFLKEYTGPMESRQQEQHQVTTGTLLYWYEVDLITARKKASQTLREINTPENRLAKRMKYGTGNKKK